MRIYLVLLLLINSLFVYSQQNYTTNSKKAIKLFEEAVNQYRQRNGEEAIKMAQDAKAIDENFIESYLFLGDMFYSKRLYQMAKEEYQGALDISEDYSPKVFYNLGKTQFKLAEHAESIKTLKKYVSFQNIRPSNKEKALTMIQNSTFVLKSKSNPVDFNPENLGIGVNSEYEDYHPSISLDGQTLIFTRKEPYKSISSDKVINREDFYYSKLSSEGEWGLAKNMGSPINTKDNEGAQCLSADGKWMYFTACHRKDGKGSCDIYYSRKVGDKWEEAKNIGAPINSTTWEAQPSISPDGKTLYFTRAMKRKDGQKVTNLLMSTLESGSWTKPVKISVSTNDNEMTPFIHADGRTLYFSSDGHPGMGGKDIFMSTKIEGAKFSEPINLGYPINTINDEHGMIVDAMGKTAYYASEKIGGQGKLDIYKFELPEPLQPNSVSFVKGKVIDQNGNPIQSIVEIIDLKTQKIVGSSFSDKMNGQYMVSLPAGQDYALNISKEGFMFFSESFSLKGNDENFHAYDLDVVLRSLNAGQSLVLKNIFFETSKFDLKPESIVELKKLKKFMIDNPSISIEIGGHTDNIGTAVLNQKLSEDRAKAVYTYLIENGIDSNRLSFKGYGALKPIASNDSDKGRAQNRRTEITVM